MTEDKKKLGIFAQILVAVVVALLVGGTAPWWWNEFFRNSKPSSKPKGGAAELTLADFLSQVPDDRITTLEVNSKNTKLIDPLQSKDEVIAVKLTNKRQIIGAVKFQFYSAGKIFKIESVIESVVDSEGQIPDKYVITDKYFNTNPTDDKASLGNWDSLRMTLGGSTYDLRLGYASGIITADHILSRL